MDGYKDRKNQSIYNLSTSLADIIIHAKHNLGILVQGGDQLRGHRGKLVFAKHQKYEDIVQEGCVYWSAGRRDAYWLMRSNLSQNYESFGGIGIMRPDIAADFNLDISDRTLEEVTKFLEEAYRITPDRYLVNDALAEYVYKAKGKPDNESEMSAWRGPLKRLIKGHVKEHYKLVTGALADILDNGGIVTIHPEGTRTQGKVGPVKIELIEGILAIAKSDYDIHTMGIDYRETEDGTGVSIDVSENIKPLIDAGNPSEVVQSELEAAQARAEAR